MINRKQIELLAPAGDAECFLAAIAAGADAIFFGLEQFSARTRAKNLTVQEAKYLIPIAHEHNCKAYLTLNTLVTDSEMQSALELVKNAVDCGIDAVIVQDLGVLSVIHQAFPKLELHASTQMTTHNSAQCEYLAKLGVSQVNLSRELSLEEIKPLAQTLHNENIVPEIFVQGAFCISYSGQCYLSGHLYGEAGNRGSCVQPCRREWSADKKFIPCFHLKDNSAFPIAKQLIQQNVPVSLKIEGRIKSADYVWAVTSAWREQIDRILNNQPVQKTSPKLTGVINRDYTAGYLEGKISSDMFSDGTKDLSLEKAGFVKAYIADSKTLIIQGDFEGKTLNKGDSLKIKTASDDFVCTATVKNASTKGYEIQITNKLTKKILPGQIVYKSTSVINQNQLKEIISKLAPAKNLTQCSSKDSATNSSLIPLNVSVNARLNQKLQITFTTPEGQKATVESEQTLVQAQNEGLTAATLEEKLFKLGGTAFTKGTMQIEVLENQLFIPLGELNNLRRKAVTELSLHIRNKEPEQIKVPELSTVAKQGAAQKQTQKNPREAVFVSASADIQSFKSKTIIMELPTAINTLKAEIIQKIQSNPSIILSINSIMFDDDLESTLNFLKDLPQKNQRTIICDNTGLVWKIGDLGFKIILGPNCNIYNSWNLEMYAKSLNVQGIIPSLELSSKILSQMHFPENIEVWYPQKMTTLLMQSRQCLVKNATNCKKTICDRICLETCNKKVLLKGKNNETISAIKRPGFYSSLYTSQATDYSQNC